MMSQESIRKYEFIDALRGIAILAVVLVHSAQVIPASDALLLRLMQEGARGVQLFFVASAITLCMSWNARSRAENSPTRNFYIRRFFRIAPMFYLAILLYSFVNGTSPSYWAPNGMQWWFIPATAAFIHGFHPETINSVVPGGWSIAVEMTFYLVFPLLLIKMRSATACAAFLVLALGLSVAASSLVRQMFFYPEHQLYILKDFASINFFAQLPVFLIGMLGYFVLAKNFERRRVLLVAAPVLAILLVGFLVPVLLLWDGLWVAKIFSALHHYLAAGVFCAFAIILAYWPLRLFVNAFTVWLGKLSFGIYLTHFAILSLMAGIGVNDMIPRSNLASISYALCITLLAAVASSYLHRWIERPGVALGRRWIQFLEDRNLQKLEPTPSGQVGGP